MTPDETSSGENQLQDEGAEIAALETQFDIVRYMRRKCEEYGLKYFIVFTLPGFEAEKLSAYSVVSNWPQEILAKYDALRMVRHSAGIRKLRLTTVPFSYDMREWIGESSEQADFSEVLDLMNRVTIIPMVRRTLFGPRVTVFTKDGKSYTKEGTGREFIWDFEEEVRRIACDPDHRRVMAVELVNDLLEFVEQAMRHIAGHVEALDAVTHQHDVRVLRVLDCAVLGGGVVEGLGENILSGQWAQAGEDADRVGAHRWTEAADVRSICLGVTISSGYSIGTTPDSPNSLRCAFIQTYTGTPSRKAKVP